jgi:signal transduction histidine kinase
VRRWLRWSADRFPWWPAAAWPAGAAIGAAAEWSAYGWHRPGDWLPDLIAGWSLIGCGSVAALRRPASRSGFLLAITGFAWFVPNFAMSDLAGVHWAATHALYLHRGPLVALVLTYPGQRIQRRLDRLAIAAGTVLAFTPAVWKNDAATICVAAGLIAWTLVAYVAAKGRMRRGRRAAVWCTVPVALGLITIAVVRLARPTDTAAIATLRGYEAMLVLLAIGVALGLGRAASETAELTDSVVELGEARSGLRDELAAALGDRSLQIGYWSAADEQYVDVDGQVVPVPAEGSERAVTIVGDEAQPVAILVHDRVFRADRELLDAVASAARLASRHTALRRATRAHVLEVAESRRRVVEAADEERRRLELRLRDGARCRLQQLDGRLRDARTSAASAQTVQRVERAVEQLARVEDELSRLARGIHPRELDERGLEAALTSMARTCALPVELLVAASTIDADVAACAYFVCSEALANIAKHARAAHVRISVRSEDGTAVVIVADDGVGGADPAHGTGLRGLADRIDTLGGELSVSSPSGGGTRLVATLRKPAQPALRR